MERPLCGCTEKMERLKFQLLLDLFLAQCRPQCLRRGWEVLQQYAPNCVTAKNCIAFRVPESVHSGDTGHWLHDNEQRSRLIEYHSPDI